MAVIRPYGGFENGSPCGPSMLGGRGPAAAGAPASPRGRAWGGAPPPPTKSISERCGSWTSDEELIIVPDDTYSTPVSGSAAPPCQFAPPVAVGNIRTPRSPLAPATIG